MTPTDDQLLTPDDLRDIEARAEAYEKASEMYTETCDTAFWLNTPETRDVEYDARIALDRAEDEFDTHARADIPALLAHIRAQDAANARLRGALAAVVGDEGDEPWIVETLLGSVECVYCGADASGDPPYTHEPDCPIAAARTLLDLGNGD